MSQGTSRPADASLSGHWKPRVRLQDLYYGSGCVKDHLLSTIPSPSSKVFIVTGKSLATKTPLVGQLEALLGQQHAGTISDIRQHGPMEDVERAVATVLGREDVDTVISLGGGSPIDTTKVISYRCNEQRGKPLVHLTIPTTLSAAECTAGGGYTKPDGVKMGFRAPEMGVTAIFYDPQYVQYTPKDLWLSTGMRAMDHAVECMYHSSAAEVPWKALALWAARELFECLPRAREQHPHDESVNVRLMLAAYASSGLKGENIPGGMGLSHSLGHALGSPYNMPHGITSCLTLGKVVQLQARRSATAATQLARLLPATGAGAQATGDDVQDAVLVGERIMALVKELGIDIPTLTTWGVKREEIPTITQRALGGAKEGPLYDAVDSLVQTLF